MTATPQPSSDAFSDHELAAWRGLLEVHARLTRELDAQMRAEHGLSLSAYEVLMFLGNAPDHRLRMSQIAEWVLLTRSGLTRLVDRLVDLGYVTRCAADTDGRGLFAELTEAGLETVNAARRTHRAGVRQSFLEHLSTTDVVVLGDIWARLRASNAPPSEGGC